MPNRRTVQSQPTDRHPFAILKSRIHGVGVHTLADLPTRKKIGELTGPLLPLRVARKLVRDQKRIFMVEIDDRWALDCSGGSALGHVNRFVCTELLPANHRQAGGDVYPTSRAREFGIDD